MDKSSQRNDENLKHKVTIWWMTEVNLRNSMENFNLKVVMPIKDFLLDFADLGLLLNSISFRP